MHSVSRHSAKILVSSWLSEESSYNLPGYDLESSNTVLVITMKTPGALAGTPFVDALAEHLGCTIEWHVKEGEILTNGNVRVASMMGATADLIHSELLVKNILSRASGIATFAKRLKLLLADLAWQGEIVSPFTHTPGFALVEEYAMFVAGVPSSRNLSSVLLPASHIGAAGGVANAISSIKAKSGKNTQVTVECGSLDEAKAAAEAGASSIRFEGLTAKDLGNFSSTLKSIYSSLIIEASANFDETTLGQFLLPNVDALTTRRMFSGYPVLDFILSYETGNLFSNMPKHLGAQKRTAATAESEQTPADTGNSNVGEESGNGDVETIKRFKSEPDSSKTDTETTRQQGLDSETVKPATPKMVKKTDRVNGNRPTPASVNSVSRKQLQQKLDQSRNQRFDITRPHSNEGNRRLQTHDRNDNRMHNNSNSGLLSSRSVGGIISHNLQSPQQQAANAFLHQARMMSLLPSRQPGIRGGPQAPPPPPPPHHRGLLVPGPTPNQQWSIMGGPPRPLQRASAGGICCRNCHMQNAPGVLYCRNCRAPTH